MWHNTGRGNLCATLKIVPLATVTPAAGSTYIKNFVIKTCLCLCLWGAGELV